MKAEAIVDKVALIQREVIGMMKGDGRGNNRPPPPSKEFVDALFELGTQFLLDHHRQANALEGIASALAKKGK